MDMSKCLDSKKRSSHDVEVAVVATAGGIELTLAGAVMFPEIVLRLVDFRLLLHIEDETEEIVDISIVLDLAK